MNWPFFGLVCRGRSWKNTNPNFWVRIWAHRGRSDSAANANCEFWRDPWNLLAKFRLQISKKLRIKRCEEFASECEWFCEWNCKNFVLAEKSPCQCSLAIANATAWCTQVRISSGGVGVFHVRGGGQKVRYVPVLLAGKPNFWVGYPGIVTGISRGCPKSLRKIRLSSIFGASYYSYRLSLNLRELPIAHYARVGQPTHALAKAVASDFSVFFSRFLPFSSVCFPFLFFSFFGCFCRVPIFSVFFRFFSVFFRFIFRKKKKKKKRGDTVRETPFAKPRVHCT